MSKRFLAAAAVLVGAVVWAQSAPVTEVVTVSTTAVGLATNTVGGNNTPRPESRYCFLSLESANIRWRVDGTAPDTNTGHIMAAGAPLELHGALTIKRFSAIRDDAADGTLTATCWEHEPL